MGQMVQQNEKSNYSVGSPRHLHMESRDDWLKMVLTGGWLSDEECVATLQLGCFPGAAGGQKGVSAVSGRSSMQASRGGP